jgi:hypothetical protein
MPEQSQALTPDDFSDFIAEMNRLHLSWFALGGQAVNVWAQRYSAQAGLIPFSPFTSKDIDICFTKQFLSNHQTSLVKVTSLDSESGLVGTLNPGPGEAFSMIPGVLFRDCTDNIASFSSGWRVPTPPVLLRAKIWNLFNAPQEGRADARHVMILSKLMPHYLQDQEFSPFRSNDYKILSALEREGALVDASHLLKNNIAEPFQKVLKNNSDSIIRGRTILISALFNQEEKEELEKISGDHYHILQADSHDPNSAYVKAFHHKEKETIEAFLSIAESVLVKFASRMNQGRT